MQSVGLLVANLTYDSGRAVTLNLDINELTKTQFDQVLIPSILAFTHRDYYNGIKIEWSFNISCSDLKIEDKPHYTPAGEHHE